MATDARTIPPADIASRILDFSNAEFAMAPEVDVHARELRLLDADFEGIAIAAQARLRTDTQQTLPIAFALRCDGERDWDIPISDNCLIVATEMQTGRVRIVPALTPLKVLASRAGPQARSAGPTRPPSEALAGYGAQLGWTEARSRIQMPWRSGIWSFSLVYFDWVSNRVSVVLEGGAEEPSPAAPPTVDPLPDGRLASLPTFVRNSRTPTTPATGVDFQLGVDARGAAKKLILDAAFETRLRPYSLVAGSTLRDAGETRQVAAIVPMTLMLVGIHSLRPWRRTLSVAVYGEQAQAGDTVQGCVSMDASAQTDVPEPGTYAAYLILDGAVHGPRTVQLTR